MNNATNWARRIAAVLLLLLTFCTGIFAQLDPTGGFIIRQNGKVVGEIYVPERAPNATLYVEHWVLYEDYVYPSPTNRATIEITQAPNQLYHSEADFFAKVRFAPGSRYVKVVADESSHLPNGR